MNQLSVIGSAATMTTKEIADLTEKQHFHVVRDAEVMFSALTIDPSGYIQSWIHPQNGQQYKQYALGRELTLTLISGYSIEMRHKIIKRWQELEDGVPQVPQTLAAALRLAADQAEQIELLALERNVAIATKAHIGDKREATAMNTASQAVKKANALAIELDKSKDYATIKRMEMLHHGASFKWRLLKSAAADLGMQRYWQQASAAPRTMPRTCRKPLTACSAGSRCARRTMRSSTKTR